MKHQYSTLAMAALAGLATAEVPQEHSHRKFLIAVNELLALNNPFEIVDSVFGFLGNAAAANGGGLVENLDCLQQITADSAFTGAKDAGDIDGMANALIFRALERNTLQVGLRSEICNETAINPEIDAITQHQDPASEDAAEVNKAITLALAQQLALIGADPLLALESGTFPPGEIGDPTAAGFTCNDETDDVGCIFTEDLLVPDATPEEIEAAVAEVLGEGVNVGDDLADSLIPSIDVGGDDAVAAPPAEETEAVEPPVEEEEEEEEEELEEEVEEDVDGQLGEEEEEAEDAVTEEPTGTVGQNLQTFTGDLGGPAPPVVSNAANADRPFEANGATFQNLAAALSRSCAVQNNACFNAANAGQLAEGTAACTVQEDACLAAASLRKMRRNARSVRYSDAGKLRFRRVAAPLSKRQTLDLGSCEDPSIQFVEGLDGRAEASFGPAGDFDHGSALNIDIISSFICGQLASRCSAADAAVAACEDGAADASDLEGQAAADVFNAALGF